MAEQREKDDFRSREGELLGGKYRLEKRLGAGGMGEVYRARNELIDREVAIKLLRPEHARNSELVERFLREARAANLVRHPNVVDVVDVGQDDSGAPFIVQELLHGRDLASMLDERGPLMVDVALQILTPIADAVAVAHSKGVVHRDLKPDNVFLCDADGGVVPKVLDFGISKIERPDARRVTATGVSMGTPAYMSPEQVEGAASVDARSDVWALGVMLHEVLSGSLPFKGDTYGALFVQICTAAPIPLRDVAPHVPEDLARVVARCLRRNAADRYASAAELARDLRLLASGASIEATRKMAAVSLDLPPPSLIAANVVRHETAPTLAQGLAREPAPVRPTREGDDGAPWPPGDTKPERPRANPPSSGALLPSPVEVTPASAPPAARGRTMAMAVAGLAALFVVGAAAARLGRPAGTAAVVVAGASVVVTPTAAPVEASASASASASGAPVEPSASATELPVLTTSAAPTAAAVVVAPTASATPEAPRPSAAAARLVRDREHVGARATATPSAAPTASHAAHAQPAAAHAQPTATPGGERRREFHGAAEYE